MTTPLGNLCSRISRLRRNAALNGGVRRLSGGLLKEKRYTDGAGCVQIMLPGGEVGLFGSRAIGTLNKAGMGAI